MFYYYVVRLPITLYFNFKEFFNKQILKNSAKGASVLDVLLLTTLPCHHLLLDQLQAARPLFRITKWAASRDRGCVDFGHHQAGRRGGEKQDGIGTGCGQGQRAPGRAPQQLQVQSDATAQVLRFIINFLHVLRGCFVFPWLFPHYDSAILSSPYSVLLSLPAALDGRRPVIADGALLFTPLTHGPTLVFNQRQHTAHSVLAMSGGGFPRTRLSC